MTDLADHLADVEIPNEEEARQSYHLDNDRDADRFLRKLARLDAEAKRLTADARDVIDDANRWLAQALGTLEGDRLFLTGALIDYHRRLRAEGRADKTYKLPAGALKAAKEQDAIVLPEDTAELVAWCLTHGRHDLLNITPSKAEIKRAVLTDGEAIPGVQAVKSEDDPDTNRYSVQVAA